MRANHPITRRTVLGATLAGAMGTLCAGTLDSTLEAATILSGRVLTAKGQPVAQARLLWPDGTQTHTDADGRFVIATSCRLNQTIEFDCIGSDPRLAHRLRVSIAHTDGRAASLLAQLPA